MHFPCSQHLSPKLSTVLCPTALCGYGRHIGWCHSGLPPCPTGTRQKSGTHYVCSGPSGKSNEKKQGHPVLGADQREGLSSAWLPQTPPLCLAPTNSSPLPGSHKLHPSAWLPQTPPLCLAPTNSSTASCQNASSLKEGAGPVGSTGAPGPGQGAKPFIQS